MWTRGGYTAIGIGQWNGKLTAQRSPSRFIFIQQMFYEKWEALTRSSALSLASSSSSVSDDLSNRVIISFWYFYISFLGTWWYYSFECFCPTFKIRAKRGEMDVIRNDREKIYLINPPIFIIPIPMCSTWTKKNTFFLFLVQFWFFKNLFLMKILRFSIKFTFLVLFFFSVTGICYFIVTEIFFSKIIFHTSALNYMK